MKNFGNTTTQIGTLTSGPISPNALIIVQSNQLVQYFVNLGPNALADLMGGRVICSTWGLVAKIGDSVMTVRTALSRALIVMAALLALAIVVLFSFPPAHAQTQVHEYPDCQFFFTFTAATTNLPSGNGFDNRQQGCKTWSIVYFNSGFSAVSVLFQSAPNNNGTAGSWGTGFPVQQTVERDRILGRIPREGSSGS